MRDLSLHLMDLAQNSVRAGASLVCVQVLVERATGMLTVAIEDDGAGMTPEFAQAVRSPFTTTRATRHIGLGIPLFEANAQASGGGVQVTSVPGQGTRIVGRFGLMHVDRPPLGDVIGTMIALIAATPLLPDYTLTLSNTLLSGKADAYTLDTRQMRAALGEVGLDTPEVIAWMRASMQEGLEMVLPDLCAEALVTLI